MEYFGAIFNKLCKYIACRCNKPIHHIKYFYLKRLILILMAMNNNEITFKCDICDKLVILLN